MSPTFDYKFADASGGTDLLTVSTTAATSDSLGFGPAYGVIAITGSIDGVGIDGMVGASNSVQYSADGGAIFDNDVFTTAGDGGTYGGDTGNTAGIDAYGLEFSVGGVEYNLFDANGTFELFPTDNQGAIQTLSLDMTNAPCYSSGTRILTTTGEVFVQDLVIGDLLITPSGALRPIRWIGTRAYDGRFIRGNTDVLPITFKQNSLSDGVPRRDLSVSPKHAMFIDGMLIPAMELVNGTSIVQADWVESIEYFHVELETHDIIIAEGALAESFVDDDSRNMFKNVEAFHSLYPNEVSKEAKYCAPRVEDGFDLAGIRNRLALRASGSEVQVKQGVLRGFVESVSLGRIQGWAQDILNPEEPVELQLTDNGAVIGRAGAGQYQARLQAAGLGSGAHGFTFIIEGGLDPAVPHDLQVRRAVDGALLQFHTVEMRQAA